MRRRSRRTRQRTRERTVTRRRNFTAIMVTILEAARTPGEQLMGTGRTPGTYKQKTASPLKAACDMPTQTAGRHQA